MGNKLLKLKNFLFSFNTLWLAVLALALMLRLIFINLNPIGLTHDEIHDIISAKSIAVTGQQAPATVSGIFTPKGQCFGNCIFGELVPFLLAFWMKIFPLSLFWTKLPFAFAYAGIVFFGGKFFENLSGSKRVGLLSALLIALNPWGILLGRSAYESLFGYLFYIVAVYLFTLKNARTKHLILAFIASFLGFLSYLGVKPIFPLIITWGVLFAIFVNKSRSKTLGIFLIFLSFVITFSYLLILPHTPAGIRLKEMSASQNEINIADTVNYQRRNSLEIPYIRDLAINKYTVLATHYISKYAGVFSPNYLFVTADISPQVFALPTHSYLYLIDAAFIFAGILAVFKKKLIGLFAVALLLIIPVPSVVSNVGTVYALRSGLIFPLLAGLSGWGVYYIYKNIALTFRVFYKTAVFCIYAVSVTYFLVLYFWRLPFEHATGWFFHDRALIRYLNLASANTTAVVKEPLELVYLSSFYSGTYETKDQILATNKDLASREFKIKSTKLTNNCDEIPTDDNTTVIVQRGMNCSTQKSALEIANPRDAGVEYYIYNDKLCDKMTHTKYPRPRNLADFNVEKMDAKEFCEKWLTNPNL